MTSYSFVCLKLFSLLVITFSSQTYPRFEHNRERLPNNSYIAFQRISVMRNALYCLTDSSSCCDNGKGDWYDRNGKIITDNREDRWSNLYVTRGNRVVSLNRKTGGQPGMWRCDIPDSNGALRSVYIYLGRNQKGTEIIKIAPICIITAVGKLTSAVIYFTLDSEANEDPPEFTLTCQSKGGPATEVVWMRNGVRIEEDSNHTTSQIIVDTSGNTVYNNTLRVRGRETGRFGCIVSNNIQDYISDVRNNVTAKELTLSSTYYTVLSLSQTYSLFVPMQIHPLLLIIQPPIYHQLVSC